MFGDNEPYLVALLTLDADEAAKLAEHAGVAAATRRARGPPGGPRRRSRPPSTRSTSGFARIEQIKRFAILDRDLSRPTGELTPTLKVKRGVVAERYGDRVKELYS